MWTYTTDSMDFVTVSTGLILPYWMGLPIRYIHIDELNNREFSKEKGNRKELFDKYDKPALKPLPHESLKPYTYVIKTVPNNYHVAYDNHYYSVPHTYYKQEVTLKASYFDIIICDSMNHLICTHKRAYKPFPKYITKEEHMPESHRYYYLENKMNAESYKSWAKSAYDGKMVRV